MDNWERVASKINGVQREIERLKTGEVGITFIPLTTPLTSTAWDGDDTKAISANNALDLNSVFSLPTGAKAVVISVEGSGSGVMWFHTSSGSFKCVTLRPKGGYDTQQGIVPISTANTIYWTVVSAAMDYVKMEIQGYWI
jgi:hypothetical protein